MANVIVNTANVVTHYSAKVIAQVETLEIFRQFVGKVGDKSAIVYMAPERYRNGKTCRVPLRKAVTTAAIEDGAAYEGQGQKSFMSETDITANERGQVFGTISAFEDLQTAVELRDEHADEAAQWWAQDYDGKFFTQMALATGSLPAAGASSQYNVYYCSQAADWDSLDANCLLTPADISRGKRKAQQRGIRPAQILPGFEGYVLFIPTEATFDLGEHEKYFAALKDAVPRDYDHVFFRGHGLAPWGYWDGVVIYEDMRPVYGGTDYTFLTTEAVTGQDIIKYEGIFLGAQALAYHEWKDITWFERIFQHGRDFEISVHGIWGVSKTVIDLGVTLEAGTDRDYGLMYFCGTANAIA